MAVPWIFCTSRNYPFRNQISVVGAICIILDAQVGPLRMSQAAEATKAWCLHPSGALESMLHADTQAGVVDQAPVFRWTCEWNDLETCWRLWGSTPLLYVRSEIGTEPRCSSFNVKQGASDVQAPQVSVDCQTACFRRCLLSVLMYITFGAGSTGSERSRKRDKTIANACRACRRRKVRCDGQQPCSACQGARTALRCIYVDSGRSTQVNQAGDKGTNDDESDPDQLNILTRQSISGSDKTLTLSKEGSVADNVNALSLSLSQSSSYLGVSSVTAVLRVIANLNPGSDIFSTGSHYHEEHTQQQQGIPSVRIPRVTEAEDVSLWEEVPAINAYFQYVHPLLPLMEEKEFRNTYSSRRRNDAQWHLFGKFSPSYG